MATSVQKKWIQVIHVAKNKTGVSDEAYRAILAGGAGVDSSSDIKTWDQYKNVMAAFKTLGFSTKRKVEPQKKRNPNWITAKQEYYIKGLWELASRVKDENSLRAIIKRITGVDDIQFIMKSDATKVILVLRDIATQAGFDPDTKTD